MEYVEVEVVVDAGNCSEVVLCKTIGSRRFSCCFFDASSASCRKPLCRAPTASKRIMAKRVVRMSGNRGILNQTNENRVWTREEKRGAHALEIRRLHGMPRVLRYFLVEWNTSFLDLGEFSLACQPLPSSFMLKKKSSESTDNPWF